jgi:hypothetical protein
MTIQPRKPTQHEIEAQQADCRFLTVKELQQPLEYVYPPELLIPTRNKFIERVHNLREAKQTQRRDNVE